MTKQQDKSSLKAKSKLTKSSNSVDKDKGIKKAKRIDEDVARLKAKELRDVKTAGLSNQDLVADKASHQRLANSPRTDTDLMPSDELQTDNTESEQVSAQHISTEQADTDKSTSLVGAAFNLEAGQAKPNTEQLSRVGQGGGLKDSGFNHWYSPHSFLTNTEQANSFNSAEFKPMPNHMAPGLTVKQIVQVNHLQGGAAQPEAMHAEGKQQQSGLVKEDHTNAVSGELHIAGLGSATAVWAVESGSGKYGSLLVDPNTGQWRYLLDNSLAKTDTLAEGEHHTEQFIVLATSNNHQQVKMLVSVEVEGSNDLPVISGLHHASVSEMGKLDKVDGQLLATDPDHNEHLQWAVSNPQGQYGRLSISPTTGQWQYLLDNKSSTTLALTGGQQAVEHFVATVTDSSGQAVKHDVSVLVTGSNEQALISGSFSGVVTEDKDVQAGELHCAGLLHIQDPDALQAVFVSEQLQGQYGQFQIDTDGHWRFSAANTLPVIQGLKTGEAVTDTVLVHSVDGSEQKITVTINGTDDKAFISNAYTGISASSLDKGAPTLDGETNASVKEDINVSHGNLVVEGILIVTDVDKGQAKFSAETLQGQFGTLSINNLGHWTYTADNSQATIQGLKTGDSLTDTLLVHSVDGTEQQITVTINGTDDKAQIAGTSSASLTEDKDVHSGQLKIDGALTVTDADNGQSQFAATSLQGQFGILSINNLGHWIYTADNSQPSIQGLKTGESVTDTLLVHSVDGTEQQITVTINGTDDKAVIAGTARASLTEDKDVYQGQLRADGNLSITDPDAGQSQFAATSLQGQFGTLSINELGHWTYTADNSQATIQGLKTGESVTDTLFVHSVDGTSQQLTVTINGTDDKAIIGGTSTASLTEDKDVHQGLLRVDGALTITDSDNGQAQFSAETLQGQFGTLSINNLGHWTYTADNSQATIQGLKTGESVTDTLLVHSVDGTEQKITLTINGTDDKAVIAGTATASLTEDKDVHAGQLRVDGALTITDSDNGQAQYSAETLQGQFGTLSINNLGHWTYTADNSQATIQGLKTGESVTDTLLVHSVDGTEQKITLTINGTDDKAVIDGTATASLTEDKDVHGGQLRVDGTLIVTDADNGQTQFNAESLQGKFGMLAINNLGHWTYTADNAQVAIQGLKTGESLTDTLLVHSVDGTEQQITVTINGTDDKATVTDAQTDMNLRGVTEDRGYIDTHYDLHYDGQLNIQDPDKGDNSFDPNIGPQTYQGIGYDTKLGGHILLMQDGHYTYTLDNRHIQDLAAGETKTDSAIIRTADGTEHTIKLSVHGTNDTPTVSAQSQSVTEGGAILNGQMIGHDIDTGAQLRYSAPQIDGLTLNPDGSYSFDPSHASYQSLASGVTKTLTIPVTVTDEHNASATQNLSISITGTNNAAVIGGVDTGDVSEGTAGQDMSPDYAQPGMAKLGQAALTADGKLDIVDPDTAESQFDPKGGAWNNSYHGQYGHLLLNTDGTWHYDVTVGSVDWVGNRKTTIGTAIDKLGEHQTLTDTITVYSKDGTSHDIIITIHGDNDRPYCSSEVLLASGKEDLTQTISVVDLLANTIDVDANDAGKLTIANLHADHGSILTNQDGTFTFTPDKDYNGQVHFTYDVLDAHAGITHTGATTTLTAVQDSAIITEVSTGSITEDGSHRSSNGGTVTELATGSLTVVDPDTGENSFQFSQFGETKIHDPYNGLLRIDSAGTWTYHVDNAKLQYLAEGQTEVVIYRVHSKDGTPYDLHINVTGTNDAPTVNQVHLTNGTEDVSYQMQASHFGFSDVDSGDTLHSISLTNLPSLTEGKFVLDGHNVSANQVIDAGDISKLQFIPAKDFNGDIQFTYTVNDGHTDSAPATGSLNIASVEDLLIDNGVRGLGVTDEDTTTHFTEAQLLEHLSDVDGPLHVSGLPTSAHGAVTANASGGYDFTPNSNYHGPAEIDYKVTDGSTEYAKTAQLSVTPITDTAQVGLSMTAQQQVMQLGTDGSASAMNNGVLQTGDQINSVAVEFNVIGGPQVTSGSTHGATYFSYANSESDNEMYAWKPSNLTIAIHGTEYATGIDTTQDTATHRYSILWDSNTGVLQVLVDGDVKFTHANVHKGQPMNGHGTLAIGQDQDVVHGQKFVLEDGSHQSHGFGVNDAFHGQIFSTSMVTNHSVAPASLQHAPLANTVDKDNGLVIDMRMSASGQLVDMTGHHQLTSFGSLTSHTVSVDTGVAIPNSDSLLNLSPHIVDPIDPDDHISKVELLGLISGTVITDGTPGHNHVVSSMTDALNIQGWDLDHLTAQLPGGNNHNMDIIVRVETTGPDGATSTTEAHQPLVLDPTKPIPNAVISGDDNKTTDEDTSISGQLLITDTDAAQAYFDTTPIDGKYGHLTIDTDGHWTYAPNATANALNKTDHVQDALIVTSLDGTQHQIVVNIDGRDDNPIVTELAAPKTVIEDGGHDHVRTSGMLSISDPDTGDTHSITEQTDVLGTYGHFSIAANGSWHYELDNALPATQALTEGQHVTETFNVVVSDNEGGQTTHTMHFDVQGSNEAPTITASTISAYEDTDYHFTKADFGFTDSDGGSLEHLTITELPPKSQGELSLNGHAITANQQISNADIPNLVFTPNLNFNGNVNFKYSVSDGHDSSAEAQATIDVASRNDAPTITPNSLSGTEDNTYSFNEADFGFTDVDNGDTLNHITITDLPDIADGKLTLNGVEVTTNQQISATDIGQLKFEPSANFHGDVDFAYSVNDGHVDSAPARASIHIASVDDPLIDSGMRDLGTTDEDTTTHFTDAQLLANLSDADGALHISGVPTSTHGTVTANASGGYDFTPNANYHGPAEIDYKVSDGTTEYAQTAHLSVSSVTDTATTSLSAEVQRTAFGLTSSADHGYIKPHGDQIESGGDLHAFTAEFTYIHDPKITIGTYQDFVMFHGVKPDGTPDMDGVNFGMWTFGGNLKFTSSHISGDNGNPGVNFNDGQDHRITMTWDGKTDTALLYDNGVLKVTVHGFAGSDHIAANPFLNVGSKYVPGHFAGQDKFPGRLLSTSFASQALTPEQIQHGPVYESVSKNNGLLIDIRSDSHGVISDQTGHHQLDIADLHTFTGEMVNIGSTALAPGDVLHMHLSVAAPIDHDDVLSKIEVLGLAKGTILSDGHHSLTIGSAVQHADVTGWDLDKVTATLPAHGDQNMLMQLVATTTGPDGVSATDNAKLPIILDVNSPVPDAVITGDEHLVTDETSTVSGQLIITDTDPSQAHFIAEVIPSAHGQFTVKADGSWEFTPSKVAETLTQNHNATDIVTVKTLDGTEQQLSVTLIGSDTAPTTVTTDLGKVESGHSHDFQATDLLANVTDVDTSTAGLSIVAGSLLSPHGTVVTNPDGSYSFTVTPGFVGNDLAISFKISDGHNTIDANAIIDVTPPLAITRLEYDTGVSDSDFVTSDGHIILYGTGEPGSTIMGSGILSGPKAIVDANGHWKMDVSATDRADGTYTLTVFEVKADGSYAQAHHKITIDTAKPTLSIDPISNDDWVNHHDHQQDLTITGATTHVADGNSVDVIVAGTHYSANVNNNHWQLVIPANQVANISDSAYQVHAEVIATATGDTAQVQRQLVVSADLSTLVQTQAVEEDSKTTATGTLFAVGASETVTTTGVLQGNYGTLQMNVDGSYQYTLDNNAAAIQQMGQTDSHADNFFISYTNNHGDTKHAVVNIGIHGTNDAPLLTGTFEISRSITTGSMTNTHSFGYINIDDIDAGDKLNIEYIDSQGGHHLLDFTPGNSNKIDVQGIGHFSIDADGRWDFTFSHSGPERDKLDQEVAAGKIHSETVTLKVTDGSGQSREEHLTVHIGDGKTGPQIFGASESVVTEDKVTQSHGLLDLLVGDVKVASGVTWELQPGAHPQYGDLTLNPDGSWQYQANNGSARVQALAEGERLEETIMVTATDSLGHSVDQAMKLVIIGTNDVPVVGHALANTVVEDHLLTLSKADLLANVHDTDAKDVLDVSHLSIVGGGTITQQGDHWVINPGVNYNGELRLNYTVTDGHVAIDNSMAIHVSPDADTPTMIFTKHVGDLASPLDTMAISGNENSDLALNINVSSPDTNETLTVEITGVPPGASLSAGTENNGIWTLQQSELTNLKVIPEADFHGHFDLSVSAISHDGSEQTSVSQTIGVDVLAAPVLAGIGQSDAPQSDTETDTLTFSSSVDADFSNVASTGVLNDPIAPVDHYFQMLGMSKDDVPTESLAGSQTELLPEVNVDNPLADEGDLAGQSSELFDNPLAEGEEQHHQLDDVQEHNHNQLVDNSTAMDSHDDELLHSALNNMHNQW
ncbi:VCBS domain-containing protein [Agarivorans sp. DSG3-1]|uniref:VCBS domain-containing protein n=1 Tax=Agarivorans sp. DSG3-1 TaxID=3342249 RepID=UPI00398F2C83